MSNIAYQFQHRVLPNWAFHSEHLFNDLVNVGVKVVLYCAISSVYKDHSFTAPIVTPAMKYLCSQG